METVRDACWHEEALHIGYAGKNQAVSGRVILPLAVIYTDRTQMVLA
jgi:predicted DNA-binding transcriptional regulator YafY